MEPLDIDGQLIAELRISLAAARAKVAQLEQEKAITAEATKDLLTRLVKEHNETVAEGRQFEAKVAVLAEALKVANEYLDDIGPPADGWGCLDRGREKDRQTAMQVARDALKKAGVE